MRGNISEKLPIELMHDESALFDTFTNLVKKAFLDAKSKDATIDPKRVIKLTLTHGFEKDDFTQGCFTCLVFYEYND